MINSIVNSNFSTKKIDVDKTVVFPLYQFMCTYVYVLIHISTDINIY